MTDGPIQVVLASTQWMFLDALNIMLPSDCPPLQSDIEVVGIATSVAEAISAANASRPAALVLDIDLADGRAADTLAHVFSECPAPAVAAITDRYDSGLMDLLVVRGAGAYVLRSDRGVELGKAIRVIAHGGLFLSKTVSRMAGLAQKHAGRPSRFDTLGRRERQVLALIADGRRSKEIAIELRVSVATVDVHRRNIMRKLDVHSVAQLTKYAIRERLIHLK